MLDSGLRRRGEHVLRQLPSEVSAPVAEIGLAINENLAAFTNDSHHDRSAASGDARRGQRARGIRARTPCSCKSIQGRGDRSVDVSRRQAHGHRLRPPAVPGRRHLLSLPAEGRRPLRQPVHDRPQRDAAASACSAASAPTPIIVDAIIGFSVVYKAFENMGGFRAFLGFQPNTRAAVLIFGLFHGFGLATKLQDFDAVAERAGHQHRQLQRRRRDRAGAGADVRPDGVDATGGPAAALSATRS